MLISRSSPLHDVGVEPDLEVFLADAKAGAQLVRSELTTFDRATHNGNVESSDIGNVAWT
jgi:hypothetical protein